MKVDCAVATVETATRRAREAETAGFSGVWAGELNQDPFLPLTLAAEVTNRVDIGTSIAVAFARSPMTLAYTANDLQRFSGGRVILGLGSQVKAHVQRRYSMPWHQPAAQIREYVLALRAIWDAWQDGTRLDFRGDFYSHTLMPPAFAPTPHTFGPPRVFMAGVGEAMTRTAGEVADGFICHGFTTTRWIRETTITALVDGARRAEATDRTFEIAVSPFIATGTDEQVEASVAGIRRQVSFYASTPAYRPILELHGWDGLGPELTTLSKAGRWDAMADLVDDDVLDAFCVVATLDELPEALRARYGDLVSRISFTSLPEMAPDRLSAFLAAVRDIPARTRIGDPTALSATREGDTIR